MYEPGNGKTDRIDRRAIPAGATETFWNAPDGQAIRRFDRAAGRQPPRGSLLFVPGRADFYEKYLEALAYWHDAGWNVTALDWRGQGLSGQLARDGVTGHVTDYGLWVDDLAQFWTEWRVKSPGPHVIVAHSMGGHIALRTLVEHRFTPDATVLCAPMLGFQPAFLPRGLLHLAARTMAAIRGRECPAWSGSERPGQMADERQDLLTHDAARFADETWWRKTRPGLALGPPSWGWIERSLASMAVLDRSGALEAVRTPVLLIGMKKDALVSYRAIAQAGRRLPLAEMMTFGPEARHEVLREVDPVRRAVLARIDAFFDRTARRADKA